MITRRALVAATAAAPLAAGAAPARAAPGAGPLPVPPGNRIGFRMLRNGDVIGNHTLAFTRTGDALEVAVAIDILVKFGPVPVYRYRHRATERWQGDQFMGIESQTDRDGTPHHMRCVRTAEGLKVEGDNTQPYTAPPMSFATTYWNKVMLQTHVINSEDGRLFRVSPAQLAEEAVPMAAGGTIRARHYKLDGDLPLDLWYDDAGQWAHLVFTKDGSTIVYEKL